MTSPAATHARPPEKGSTPLVETACAKCGAKIICWQTDDPRCATCIGAGLGRGQGRKKLKRDKYAALVNPAVGKQEKSPLSDGEREMVQSFYRGRQLGPQSWRNFCLGCGVPMVVHDPRDRKRTDMACADCAPPVTHGHAGRGCARTPGASERQEEGDHHVEVTDQD